MIYVFFVVNSLPILKKIYGSYLTEHPIALVNIVVDVVNAVKIIVYVSVLPEAKPTKNASAVSYMTFNRFHLASSSKELSGYSVENVIPMHPRSIKIPYGFRIEPIKHTCPLYLYS